MVIFAYIIAIKTDNFNQTIQSQDISYQLDNNISTKARLAVKNLYFDSWSLDSVHWYIDYNSWLTNIFWNNSDFSDFMSFYTWTYSIPASVSSWMLTISTDTWFYIKVVEFDKNYYDIQHNLKIVKEWSWVFWTWVSWYIWLSWSDIIIDSSSWASLIFDFARKDYWIFLNYSWSPDINAKPLKYILHWLDFSWNPVIINPVKDKSDEYYSFFGNYVIFHESWFLSEEKIIDINKNYDSIMQNIIN